MSHRATLMEAQVADYKSTLELLSKRRRAKKTRLCNGASLSQQDAQDLKSQKEVTQQTKQEDDAVPGPRHHVKRGVRRCGVCGKTGHNARTCIVNVESTEEEDSD